MVDKYLVNLAYTYEGNWNKIRNAIGKKEGVIEHKIVDNYITILDDRYPSCLKELKDPPWVLFYKGDLSLLQKSMVTIVGSRNMCSYGEIVTKKITNYLKQDHVIVSGLAKGVDVTAHKEALLGGKTIAVVGHGLYYQYPYCNSKVYTQIEKDGLLLSEFPFYTSVKKYNFPVRNRLLAALGNKIIVTQASIRSGTMLTVNSALELGKEVYCVPYAFDSQEGAGCNRLIDEGAQILYDFNQL